MSSTIIENKENLLKGIGKKETLRAFLEMIMNESKYSSFKVVVKDNREFLGSIKYLDKHNLFLINCEEHYKGSPTHGNQSYIRDSSDVLIPLNLIKSIEIEKKFFNNCYEEFTKNIT
ncbi:conserved Plasmodium protein, unknown function [Plasmodium yoelii]|nr:conserved Plasmodium protein, unknown function [Plasmodium yoelii]CDU17326.1 conserved Plasmodium protein, unknown function [Plasmodium yoelii]VTZ76588.1 conserved Plasmodium protein, unknown function [Plasmodium yoelii]|eukprot:XP_022811845.1 conserved Plasmodium protein, unknown function [Plasmodium yoelii]